ncbi:hypothetical protein Sphch_3809 [Sphingobium chlorophenolicum L-1]|uniref:EthD domain-containing protein n=1 Tax=Sphingobium chlorophenolicum L-1 TaxID=690566 RepID=F6F1H5_SPHCR|nr:EthD domain-containing protein [Sphingobium chlorophenolicum]AEG51391.1 hypothetical protein Sphch_3809 [Sphingobium chlorophenolicum L-1]
MMKFFVFGRNKPGWTTEDYHRTLLFDHAELVQGCDGFVRHCAGYVQNHVQSLHAVGFGDGPVPFPDFRNCSEFWFEDQSALANAYDNDDYMRMLRPDEQRFGNAAERVAYGRTGEAVRQRASIATGGAKLMVLHDAPNDEAGILADATRNALRHSAHRLTQTMDFVRLVFVEDRPLPFRRCDEYWYADAATLLEAMSAMRRDGGPATPMVMAHVVEHWVLPPDEYRRQPV